MKKITKQFQELLKKMGFKLTEDSKEKNFEYRKQYGKMAIISVCQDYDEDIFEDEKEHYDTHWDFAIIDDGWANNELLTSLNNHTTETIKNHKQDMLNAFNDLEIINNIMSQK